MFIRSVSAATRVALTLTMLLAAAPLPSAVAAPIYLSDYLGVASGEVTSSSFAPYMTVVQAPTPYQFGADRPGNFATNLVSFSDAGPFDHAIGAHPNVSAPEVRLDFDLDAFRADGHVFDFFHSVVGIDAPSGGELGAVFNVYLDGALAETATVAGVGSSSIALVVPLGTASILGLETLRFGGSRGNHAAWADAQLNAIPLPGAGWLMLAGIAALAGRVSRRGRRTAR